MGQWLAKVQSTLYNGIIPYQRGIAMFEDILREFEAYDRIIIHRHKNPDGDALGSQLGLKHILRDAFPHKDIYAVGDAAGRYAFMAGSVMDEIPDSTYDNALAVILDCGAAHLISDERYTTAKGLVRIDHHIFTGAIAPVEVIDASAESCSSLIALLATEAAYPVSDTAAALLFTGITTDSGRFRYDSTSARTFRVASFLMERSIDLNDLYRSLYATSYAQLKLRAQFTLKIAFTPRKVAYIYTTLEEMEQLGVDTFTVSRGMVNVMADIQGVDAWVNFTETPAGVLCELRSSRCNINPIAVKYGGGGHAKASGATVASREEAMAMLRDLDELTGENP